MFGRSTILAFHQTSNRFYPGINNIRPHDFFAILDLIRGWRKSFWNGEDSLPNDGSADRVVITFDDGYRDQFDIFVRLRRDGITPIVFIPTSYIGESNRWEYSSRLFPSQHLDRDQIRRLADIGVVIGSHGASHRSLVNMSDALIRQELADSRRILEDLTGGRVDLVSFPFGRVSSRVNAIAQECGYRNGFELERRDKIGPDDGFVLSRIPVYGIDDYYSLKARLLRGSRLEKIKNRIIGDLSGGTIITSGKLK
jgi:peptidoglycan/xylan/chitin deacetylase (PgdA/CDA1 family)